MSTTTKRKEFASTIAKADKPRTFEFTISTGAADRENDTINPAGWQLDSYRRNPVVLWAHDYSRPPIARATDIRVSGATLKATIEFPEPGTSERSDEVRGLVEQGFINATSVGFKPITYVRNEQRGGLDFQTQELLEFSLVPVPANPACLITGKAFDRARLGAFLGVDLRTGAVDDVLELDDDEVDLSGIEYADAARELRDHVEVSVSAADVKAALREGLHAEVDDQVRRAILRARGRID